MSLFLTFIIALVVLIAGFNATYLLGDNGHERVALLIRIGLAGATSIFGFFVILMFPYDLVFLYQTKMAIAIACIFIVIFIIISLCLGKGRKDIASDDAIWCHFLHAAVGVFIIISYVVGGEKAYQAHQIAYAAAPVSYAIEETTEIHASTSADTYELDASGFLAFHIHGEASSTVRVWHPVPHPAYPDRSTTTYQRLDFAVDDNLIVSYISPGETPRVEIGVFTRDMPDPWPDEEDRRITTIFVPEDTIKEVGINIS